VVGYTDEPLSLGSLKGNRFSITVRNISALPKGRSLVPNFFDEQRFSTNNDLIGNALVKGDFKEACALIDDERLNAFLKQQPNNYVSALRMLPKKLLTLYVHAYQSRLFNKVLEKEIEQKSIDAIKNVSLPIIGFGSEDTVLYDDLLAKEGISTRDFIIRELPDVSSEGGERAAFILLSDLSIGVLEDDEFNKGMKKTLVSFSLPKGAYATNVIKWLFSQH
jgi:tRNA pseudouridine13 synthase